MSPVGYLDNLRLRFHMHFTHRIELGQPGRNFFGLITDKLISRSAHLRAHPQSRYPKLDPRIGTATRSHFVWAKATDEILNAVQRFLTRIYGFDTRCRPSAPIYAVRAYSQPLTPRSSLGDRSPVLY